MEQQSDMIIIEQWSLSKDDKIRGVIDVSSWDFIKGEIFESGEESNELVYVVTFEIKNIKFIPQDKILIAYDETGINYYLGYPSIFFIISTLKNLKNYNIMNDKLLCKFMLKECQTQTRANFSITKSLSGIGYEEEYSDLDEDDPIFDYESDDD